MIKLNLGSGQDYRKNWTNCDIAGKRDKTINLEEKLPFPDNHADEILLQSVIEHIWNYQQLIKETARILKPNGTLTIELPFMHAIHGSGQQDPESKQDYWRITPNAMKKLLEQENLKIENIRYNKGRFNLIINVLLPGKLPGRIWPIRFGKLLDKIIPDNKNILSYTITAKK